VVDGSGGYAMTAAHVGKKVGNSVSRQGRQRTGRSGEVIALKPDNDMAIIKLRGFAARR